MKKEREKERKKSRQKEFRHETRLSHTNKTNLMNLPTRVRQTINNPHTEHTWSPGVWFVLVLVLLARGGSLSPLLFLIPVEQSATNLSNTFHLYIEREPTTRTYSQKNGCSILLYCLNHWQALQRYMTTRSPTVIGISKCA